MIRTYRIVPVLLPRCRKEVSESFGSGGALLNMYGEVIGISTAGIDEGQNLNLAVGYSDILPFVRGFI